MRMSALLRLTARPHYWRIAVIFPDRILWRTYSRGEYPTPEDAVARCLAGLSHEQHEPCPCAAGQNGQIATVKSVRVSHSAPRERAALRQTPESIARESCVLSLPGGVQPQTDQRAEECRHRHAQPQSRLPAVKGDEATQHPRPLRAVSIRAAWWGCL